MNRQISHCLYIDKEVGKLLLENVYERKIIDIMTLEKQTKNEIIINMISQTSEYYTFQNIVLQ